MAREPDTTGASAGYDALVFDNDGILIELTGWNVLREAIVETFREFDVDPTDAHVEAMMGVTVEDLERICGQYELVPEEFWYRRDMNVSAAQRREIREGRKSLYDDVSILDDLPHDLGIVSNNQHRTVEFIVEHCDLPAFEAVHGREPTIAGIERKKPDSYYIERAIDDLGTDRVLYVGDSGVDVLAAAAVDVDCAFVRRPHRDGYDLPAAPTYEIDTLTDLPALLDGEAGTFQYD